MMKQDLQYLKESDLERERVYLINARWNITIDTEIAEELINFSNNPK